MKITYTNDPHNKQKRISPSMRTIVMMTCVVAVMVAIKVIYVPERGMEEMAAFAEMAWSEDDTQHHRDETSPDTEALDGEGT